MSSSFSDRVLALAALAQSLQQVRRIAETGHSDAAIIETAMDSVFRIDAADTRSVFGHVRSLQPGLQLLRGYFSGDNQDDALPRLGLSVLQLERRFIRDPELADHVARGVEALSPQAKSVGSTHPDVLAGLGGLYAETLSQLKPRVMVQGNPHYLGQPGVVAEIRAILLAAVRAAVLWRQLGGSYWDFLFSRRAMVQAIDEHLH